MSLGRKNRQASHGVPFSEHTVHPSVPFVDQRQYESALDLGPLGPLCQRGFSSSFSFFLSGSSIALSVLLKTDQDTSAGVLYSQPRADKICLRHSQNLERGQRCDLSVLGRKSLGLFLMRSNYTYIRSMWLHAADVVNTIMNYFITVSLI